MTKDDLIAEAINLGLGKNVDLVSYTKEHLSSLIKEKKAKKPRVYSPPNHAYYRG